MHEKLAELINRMDELERKRAELAEKLREEGREVYPEALEKGLIHKVEPVELNCRVAAVDGGLGAQEFHGFDLVLTRAVSVIFEYKNSKRISHSYHPSRAPEAEPSALTALDSHEFTWHKSLARLKKEVETACETVKKFKPDYLLLDGSIVPQISDKPSENSSVRPLYNSLLELYNSLYSYCKENNCQLIGVIKDSRGKRFIEIVEKTIAEGEILKTSNDTSFLHFLLNEGERVFEFHYSSPEREHQVLKDLGKWGASVHAFYVKPVKNDRPLRVEFLKAERTASEVASLIYSLSRINQKYAYPAVLIEADMRAALEREEVERVCQNLLLRAGRRVSFLPLRSNSRPFR
ncbi:MAG: DNA double-strand break repair nuclease NurA [Candidatus Micrarchaeia archaeon]